MQSVTPEAWKKKSDYLIPIGVKPMTLWVLVQMLYL